MKKIVHLSLVAFLTIAIVSCDSDDSFELVDSVSATTDGNTNSEEPTINYEVPTSVEVDVLIDGALANATQYFAIDVNVGDVTLVSDQGVAIMFHTSCFNRVDGSAVEGNIDLEFVEVFDKSSMLTLNKPTMGVMGDDKALLISGGEFYLNASNNGEALEITCGFTLSVPANLTGGVDMGMSLWTGQFDQNEDLTWVEDVDPAGNDRKVGFEGGNYYIGPLGFGWTNIDKFYSDPRPKTTILVDVPAGYDSENSLVYVSFNDQDSSLAKLDVYDDVTELFSEHYGQIPVGLECNLIFMTEENDEYRYAIKPLTIVANDTIVVSYSETITGDLAQLKQAINNLP